MHPVRITLWWVTLIFLFVLSTGNKVFTDSLGSDLCFEDDYFQDDLQDVSHIDYLSFQIPFVQFRSRFLAGNTCIHGPIHVCYYLLVLGR